jgi:hypothetical protein
LREWTDRNPPNGASDGPDGRVLAQAALLEMVALLQAWRAGEKKG